MQLSIYDFNDARDFVKVALTEKQKKNPSFSLRSWARSLKLSHHAILSMTLSKKRRFSAPLAARVRDGLGLEPKQARYFDLLVAFNNSDSLEQREFYAGLLRDLSPDSRPFHELTLDAIHVISRWHHSALLEMLALKDFSPDLRWITTRLGGKVPLKEIEESIARLERLGLVDRDEKTGNLKRTQASIKTPDDVPNASIQSHHREMIEKALEALSTQKVNERETQACTLPIDVNKMDHAKSLIRDFMSKFIKEMAAEPGDEVYQINLQFFRITETKK